VQKNGLDYNIGNDQVVVTILVKFEEKDNAKRMDMLKTIVNELSPHDQNVFLRDELSEVITNMHQNQLQVQATEIKHFYRVEWDKEMKDKWIEQHPKKVGSMEEL